MNAKDITTASILSVLCFLISGCASIVDGGAKSVQIRSNPPGAKLSIYDRTGILVAVEQTPKSISLKRDHGYFTPEKYSLHFELPGYDSSDATLEATMNGWYVGNLVFGGLIGFFIVDPATGAMWTFQKDDICTDLWPTKNPDPKYDPLARALRDSMGYTNRPPQLRDANVHPNQSQFWGVRDADGFLIQTQTPLLRDANGFINQPKPPVAP